MVEISSEFHPVPQAPPVNRNKHFSAGYFSEPIIKCEECASAKICKEIGSFRRTCDSGVASVSQDNSVSKCIAGTNILLARLLKKLDRS